MESWWLGCFRIALMSGLVATATDQTLCDHKHQTVIANTAFGVVFKGAISCAGAFAGLNRL
jgi:hypothetical protein